MLLLTLILASFNLYGDVVMAESLYKEKRYDKAMEIYLHSIDQNIRDPFIFYNLGNCYFKTNKIGKSVLYYKRAKRLLPGDSDINFNLDFARSQRIDVLNISETPKFFNYIINLPDRFPLNVLNIISSILFFLIFILLSLSLFYKNKVLKNVNIGVIILFICFLLLFSVNLKNKNVKEGVLISVVEAVRSGPREDYALLFTLHEGAEFRILEEDDGWSKIILQTGLTGWLKKEFLEKV
ncbi:SH3 domain-containing protein [candidate division WOR-3 bacterium]|nr:SH3 domain-containing protein [candidate division WOR-3 bacterium]